MGSLCPPTSYYTSKSLKSFLEKIQCSHVGNEPPFMEIMNESIFESLIKEMFDAGEQHTDPNEQGLQLTIKR